ncbi:hypothetical protein ACFOY5_04525 [Massilia aurea]|uniref:hypothetical protein n=1 Tax=Massilia aurea TaxID=373040 RepID=UPI00216170E7|nr:hypothetical protein [Massilia aurea]MCS0707463.1 hypothetical protein [Massilia aurea]
MAIPTEPVSALTLILSSAVVSAGVNVTWSVIARYLDRRKEAQKIDHVYLSLALQMEEFARQCNGRIYDVSEALRRYYDDHDMAAFENFSRFVLDFAPEPDWVSLPIPFVAKIKSLQSRFDQCNSWVNMQSQLWAGLDDAYALDEERLAFYGKKACETAADIRSKIKAGPGENEDLISHFDTVLESRRSLYSQYPDSHTFIPELRAQFDSLCPAH